MFSQAILGFFHHHDESDHISATIKKCGINEASLSKQTIPCKICSLDIIHELFYVDQTSILFSNISVNLYQETTTDFYSAISFLPKGRAPPSSLFI
jgi:hypothetical protein